MGDSPVVKKRLLSRLSINKTDKNKADKECPKTPIGLCSPVSVSRTFDSPLHTPIADRRRSFDSEESPGLRSSQDYNPSLYSINYDWLTSYQKSPRNGKTKLGDKKLAKKCEPQIRRERARSRTFSNSDFSERFKGGNVAIGSGSSSSIQELIRKYTIQTEQDSKLINKETETSSDVAGQGFSSGYNSATKDELESHEDVDAATPRKEDQQSKALLRKSARLSRRKQFQEEEVIIDSSCSQSSSVVFVCETNRQNDVKDDFDQFLNDSAADMLLEASQAVDLTSPPISITTSSNEAKDEKSTSMKMFFQDDDFDDVLLTMDAIPAKQPPSVSKRTPLSRYKSMPTESPRRAKTKTPMKRFPSSTGLGSSSSSTLSDETKKQINAKREEARKRLAESRKRTNRGSTKVNN